MSEVVGGEAQTGVSAGLAVFVDEPIVVPNLETGRDMRKHIQTTRDFYGRPVIIAIDMVRVADVVAVVEEMDAVSRHRVRSTEVKRLAL